MTPLQPTPSKTCSRPNPSQARSPEEKPGEANVPCEGDRVELSHPADEPHLNFLQSVRGAIRDAREALTTDRRAALWSNADGTARLEALHGRLSTVESLKPSLGNSRLSLQGEYGLKLDGDLVSGDLRRTEKNELGTVTDGLHAGVTVHGEAVQHFQVVAGKNGKSAEERADEGLHRCASLNLHAEAYRNWSYRLSGTSTLEAGVTLGINHSVSQSQESGTSRASGLSATAVQSFHQDLSNQTFLGDRVHLQANASEGVYADLRSGQLSTAMRLETALEKTTAVSLLGKSREVTVSLGGNLEELAGRVRFQPTARVSLEI